MHQQEAPNGGGCLEGAKVYANLALWWHAGTEMRTRAVPHETMRSPDARRRVLSIERVLPRVG